MAIFNRSKKIKKDETGLPVQDVPAFGETEKIEKKTKKPSKKTPIEKVVMSDPGMVKNILRRMWISERATDLHNYRQYVFLVSEDTTKNEIKKEIQRRYAVSVEGVNTVRMRGKTKRWAGRLSRRSGFKKAIVTLAEGEKIDVT